MKSIPALTDVTRVPLNRFPSDTGTVTVGEGCHSLPFAVERFFLVTGVPEGAVRGRHAHKRCAQALICVSGNLQVSVSDGSETHRYFLSESGEALIIPPLIWAEQHKHSSDAILLVLASHLYDADDYIHSFDELVLVRKTASI